VVLENDQHPAARRRATLGHELAHHFLEHEFATQLVNERGCRTADPEDEAAARELGAELLLPFDAAKRLARQKASDDEAALKFQVSRELARWRLDATGARMIAQRWEGRRAAGQ
jgi:Zn-dependent peptidase ImmA (M78 family)